MTQTDSRVRWLVAASLLAGGSAAGAEDSGADASPANTADPVDVAFLEYLGSWDQSDEDWMLFDDEEESEEDAQEERETSADESAETTDEG